MLIIQMVVFPVKNKTVRIIVPSAERRIMILISVKFGISCKIALAIVDLTKLYVGVIHIYADRSSRIGRRLSASERNIL